MTPTEQGITIFIGVIVSAIITVAWVLAARATRARQQREAQRIADRERERIAHEEWMADYTRLEDEFRQAKRDWEKWERHEVRKRAAKRAHRAAARQTSIGVHMRNKNRRTASTVMAKESTT